MLVVKAPAGALFASVFLGILSSSPNALAICANSFGPATGVQRIVFNPMDVSADPVDIGKREITYEIRAAGAGFEIKFNFVLLREVVFHEFTTYRDPYSSDPMAQRWQNEIRIQIKDNQVVDLTYDLLNNVFYLATKDGIYSVKKYWRGNWLQRPIARATARTYAHHPSHDARFEGTTAVGFEMPKIAEIIEHKGRRYIKFEKVENAGDLQPTHFDLGTNVFVWHGLDS